MKRHDKPVRVAIYTRKSVEDAEDKAFNSIDAQRQMCESFRRGGSPCRNDTMTTATAEATLTVLPTGG